MLQLKITDERLNFLHCYINSLNISIQNKISFIVNMDLFFYINNQYVLVNGIIIYMTNIKINEKYQHFYSNTEYNMLLYDIKFKKKNIDELEFIENMYIFLENLNGIYSDIVFNLKYENTLTFYLMDLNGIQKNYYNMLKNNNNINEINAYYDKETGIYSLIQYKKENILTKIKVKSFDINTFTFEV